MRLLRPETLALMVSNRLTESQRLLSNLMRIPILGVGHGFGIGVAMVVEPETATSRPCSGGVGAVGRPGGFGGWWRADPNDNSVLIFLAHNVELEQFAKGIGLGGFPAITEFQALASASHDKKLGIDQHERGLDRLTR
jgi:hypothetical protein